MGLGDCLSDKIEDASEVICNKVEDTGRKIARRSDAMFGSEEYENAPITDRLSGIAESHQIDKFMSILRTVTIK